MFFGGIALPRSGGALRIAILVFIVCIALFIEYKPKMMYNDGPDATPKMFGVKAGQTPFTIFNISTIISILVLVTLHRMS